MSRVVRQRDDLAGVVPYDRNVGCLDWRLLAGALIPTAALRFRSSRGLVSGCFIAAGLLGRRTLGRLLPGLGFIVGSTFG
jgi:hypothetical protein